MLVVIRLGCGSKESKKCQKGHFWPIFGYFTSQFRPKNDWVSQPPGYIATCVEYLHVKFGTPSSNVAEEDSCRVGLVADFWNFWVKKQFLWHHQMKSPLFRLFNGKIGLYGHSRTKFVLDPKIGSGLTAKKRMLTIVLHILQSTFTSLYHYTCSINVCVARYLTCTNKTPMSL